MAQQFSDQAPRSTIRQQLNEAIQQLNTTRRDWFTGFDGPRCYYGGKKWDLVNGGSPGETPGQGSSWNEVVESSGGGGGGGTGLPSAFLTPTGTQITNTDTTFTWRWDSGKTPSSYWIQVYNDGVLVYTSGGVPVSAHTVTGIPLDGSNIKVDVNLTYSDTTSDLVTKTFTTTGTNSVWLSPVTGTQVNGGTLTAQWQYGSKTPQSWTLTATNSTTAAVINTYNGTAAASQVVTGLPDNGNAVTLSLVITYTDSTLQTLTSAFTNGVTTISAQVTMTAGANLTGEVVVSGAVAQWTSPSGTVSGNAQTNFATGGGEVEISSTGTVVELNFPNAGLTSLRTAASVRPTRFNIRTNPQLSIPVGDVDWTNAQHLELKDTGAGVLLRDQDIPTPGNVTYFDICNAPGATVSGPVIGQMTSATKICIQATGIGLTDAHMTGTYNALNELLVGYNGNVALGLATLQKMPNLTQFHCPGSSITAVSGMFVGKSQLSNIDITSQIGSQVEMDAILGAIRTEAENNTINGGVLGILTGNPAPTGGSSNADIVYLQSTRGWTVT